jgi:hypothetical protein
VADPDTGAAASGAAATAAGGRRRSVLVSLVGLALLAVLVSALVLSNRDSVVASPGPDPSVSSSASPSPSASSGAPSATPSPSAPAAVPAGFEDCTDALGDDSYCPATPECWAGVISVFDLPSLGTPRECDETHVYQTFAAGTLATDVRRQSQLEDDDRVGELCSRRTLRGVLGSADRQTDWEILSLPPQEADGSDRIFRCLFGRGDRSTPVTLQQPR